MAIVDDAALWGRRFEEMNSLANAITLEVDALKKEQPDSVFWKHQDSFRQTIFAYLSVTSTYFKGFDAIFRGVEGVKASDELRNWVRTVDRHRSVHTIASMNAAACCSSLEGFLRALIPEWVDQRVVDRVRASYRRPTRSGAPEPLSSKPDSARKQLDTWLKPSGGAAFAEWLKLVSMAFQCKFTTPTEVVLEDMIRFRHTITHPTELLVDGAIDSPGAERLTCWQHATISMACTVTSSIVRAERATK